MSEQRLISLIGLAFGDCGKGLFTDYLARQFRSEGTVTVVRWNGGAQAGHNVVLPDGSHHTFSQFGAGTFVSDVRTLLAFPVVVHPTALLVEYELLKALGIDDAIQRLMIDARCIINTPFHQASGRLRELARASSAHGSCGVGVGETMNHALSYPNEVLRYGDLTNAAILYDKLEAIRKNLLSEWANVPIPDASSVYWRSELKLLQNPEISKRWLEQVLTLVSLASPASQSEVGNALQDASTLIFEGAQGVLLDEWRGFHPYTTWSNIHPIQVQAVLNDAGIKRHAKCYGVLRSYLTRHGHGPFPTEDSELNRLPEPHNLKDSWRGGMRRGHPDEVLLRYSIETLGKLEGLLVSHLDIFSHPIELRWCEAYSGDISLIKDTTSSILQSPNGSTTLKRLPVTITPSLDFQSQLTQLLFASTPVYSTDSVSTAVDLIARVEQSTQTPVCLASYGPSYDYVRVIKQI